MKFDLEPRNIKQRIESSIIDGGPFPYIYMDEALRNPIILVFCFVTQIYKNMKPNNWVDNISHVLTFCIKVSCPSWSLPLCVCVCVCVPSHLQWILLSLGHVSLHSLDWKIGNGDQKGKFWRLYYPFLCSHMN